MRRPLHVVILAGGAGKRMNSALPKVLHEVLGRPIIHHILTAVRGLAPARIIIVGGEHLPALRSALAGEPGLEFARQPRPLGTGHAVKCALKLCPASGVGDVLVTNGDTPLVTTAGLKKTLAHHRRTHAQITVVSALVDQPEGLGRIIRGPRGAFERIVEEKDATDAERAIREINSGQYLVERRVLHALVPKIGRANAQREYYLTDIVGLCSGRVEACIVEDPNEARGINRPDELSEARRIMKKRVIDGLVTQGVNIVDPDLTYVEVGVKVGEGTTIYPFSVLEAGVSIGAQCAVGPFAHLKGGTTVPAGARVGSSLKAAATGPRRKVSRTNKGVR